jgi:hypothetical protein
MDSREDAEEDAVTSSLGWWHVRRDVTSSAGEGAARELEGGGGIDGWSGDAH